MQTSKIRGIMAEKGITQERLAAMINMDRSTLNRKLKNGESFTIGEASRMAEALELARDDAVSIFLPKLSQ